MKYYFLSIREDLGLAQYLRTGWETMIFLDKLFYYSARNTNFKFGTSQANVPLDPRHSHEFPGGGCYLWVVEGFSS